MFIRSLLYVNGLITVLFGTGLLFFPEQMSQMNGIEADAGLILANRQHGAANIGLAVLSWLAATFPGGRARFAVLISFLVGYGLSLLVSLIDLAGGEAGLADWSGMIVTAGFTLAFAAAAVKERRDGTEANEW